MLALHDARALVRRAGWPPLRGDLQTHTTWSDGLAAPEAMVEAAARLGYDFLAVTDHTVGLRIARGLDGAGLWRQQAALQALAAGARAGGRMTLRIIAGAEANLLPDGTLDLPPEDLRVTELLVVGAHAALRRPGVDQTPRLLAGVTHPLVHVLAHPRGRVAGRRPGIEARWPDVFAAAAEHGTAVEVNAYPDRQDLDATLIPEAARAGCLFAVGSDAHAPHHLAWVDIAVAHLVRAGVPPDRVLNTWDLPALEGWLRRKR